ncbi:biotin synthase BioB [Anaerobacillus alkalilacustris]|uniref:Biotin synthase n=1 Tax=Anaerobacillus alkalilacustris TaxID=393763 RepID=A0A1S2LL46_9BACI|nr:biotin synthase BioB [Anaerobacillus alkalilacustris]OIJ13064.1 biotin synthase BioB [Anaerobacillus alkalilacustris]
MERQSETIVWETLAEKALQGELLTLEEASHVLTAPDEELLHILQAAYKVRKHYYSNKVKLNMIMNAKSGNCSEDCGYCSQSSKSSAEVESYKLLDKDLIVKGAYEAMERKVGTYCIVASGRGPTNREIDQVIEAVKEIKNTTPLKICTCLGILSDDKAKKLKEAGVDRYNHNLNTSEAHHINITTTHTYSDRIETLENIKRAGISPCSGCIIGMGETHADIYNTAVELRNIDADSIPVNFLHPIEGTKLESLNELNPRFCLKVLALFRFINPSKEIRISGGREVNLRSLQVLGLYAANSLFVGDYLTTDGQEFHSDHQMIEDLGFEIEEC